MVSTFWQEFNLVVPASFTTLKTQIFTVRNFCGTKFRDL